MQIIDICMQCVNNIFWDNDECQRYMGTHRNIVHISSVAKMTFAKFYKWDILAESKQPFAFFTFLTRTKWKIICTFLCSVFVAGRKYKNRMFLYAVHGVKILVTNITHIVEFFQFLYLVAKSGSSFGNANSHKLNFIFIYHLIMRT